MGADIHLYLEHKTSKTANHFSLVSGKTLDKIDPTRNDQYRELYKNDPRALKACLSWANRYFYLGRNYALFAMLSNVRNDGSIESLTNGDLTEVPYDTSDKVANEYRHWGQDAHSLTILTLKELLVDNKDFWEKPTTDYDGKACKYKDLCETFYAKLNKVATYAKWQNLDQWRIVCWYDN